MGIEDAKKVKLRDDDFKKFEEECKNPSPANEILKRAVARRRKRKSNPDTQGMGVK